MPDTTDWYVPHAGDRLFAGAIVTVLDGKTEPRAVAEQYEETLRMFSLPYARNNGVVAWDEGPAGFRLLARPNEEPLLYPGMKFGANPNVVLPPEGPPEKRQPPFPDPAAVAAVYESFASLGRLPVARERGGGPDPKNLVPAVVAWYLGGRDKNLAGRARKAGLTKLVKKLLPDWAKEAEVDKLRLNLWRDLEKAQPQIWWAEGAITVSSGRLHKFFLRNVFI